jgi:(S)-2-hydroxy-acid oxidase
MLTAAEAFRQKTVYGLSMLTSTKVSEITAVNPTGLKILQLYFMKNTDYTLNVIRMAEKQGFKAFAITVDTQMFGKRRRDERAQFNGPVEL